MRYRTRPLSKKARDRYAAMGTRLLRAHMPEITAWLDAGWVLGPDGLLQPQCASMMLPFKGHILKAPHIP